jgi:hypothetical protein
MFFNMNEFDALNQMFEDSQSEFLHGLTKFRTKKQTIVVEVEDGQPLEMPTPTKCWQWSYFIFIDQNNAERVTFFINGQRNTGIAKGNNFTGAIVPRWQYGVPYIQKEDVFTFENNTGQTVTIIFEFDLLTFENE